MADVLSTFFVAFGLLFIAELGDKTQLIILTLASQGRSSKKLAIGATGGFGVIVLLGGLIAVLLNNTMELSWISLISGGIFIIIGAFQCISLFRDSKKQGALAEPEGETDEKFDKITGKNQKSDLWIGFIAIVSMELGDKTQVMTIVLAASSLFPVATLLGAWAALSLLAVIGAFAGIWLSKKVPKKTIDWIASLLFLVIGLVMVISNV